MTLRIKATHLLSLCLLFSSLLVQAGAFHDQSILKNTRIKQSSIKKTSLIAHKVDIGNVCGTDNNLQNWSLIQQEHKELLANKHSFAAQLLSGLKSRSQKIKAMGDGVPGRYYIPVVVHVYGNHFNCNGGGACLTDEKIQDALTRTNEDFLGLNTQDGPIAAEFQAIRENLSIEFVLAKRDPDGNATNGIVRYNRDQSGYGNGSGYDTQIAADAWDNFKYMNVFIMRDLYANGESNNSGVAWYPQVSMSQSGTARVVYNGNYLGSNTNENFRSVLTHEFGHWLNLPHVFDGDVCSVHQEAFCAATGDRVCDTPQMSSSILQNNATNCLGRATNTENFMHYSDNYAMYTQGQVKRMVAALHGPARATLWSNENLIATGLADLTSDADHPWDGSGVDTVPEGEVLKTVDGISGNKGDNETHTIDLPSGTEAVAFYLDGYTQDPDMYVSKGSAPIKEGDNWIADFISFRASGQPELVTVTAPSSSETYYTTIDAYSDFSNAKLQVISADDPTLCEGCERIFLLEETGLSAPKGEDPKRFQFEVPSDAQKLIVVIPGGYGGDADGNNGDPDLYVSMNQVPTTDNADCGPFAAPKLSEYCELGAGGGTAHIMIVPFIEYSDVTLQVYYERSAHSGIPVAEANGPYSEIVNQPINFSSAGSDDSDGVISVYHWDFGDGQQSNQQNPVHTYTATGDYVATLTVTDDSGLTASDTAQVTIVADNLPPTANANGPYNASVNQAINFSSQGSTDADGSIAEYHWDFGDGNSSNQANPQHAYSQVGQFQATLTVTDNLGATDISIAEVNVSDIEYCTVSGNTRYEWIAKVKSGSFENSSDKEGYGDFSSMTMSLTEGNNTIELTAGGSYSEHWAAWIDLNRDGEFDAEGEKVLVDLSGRDTVVGQLFLPDGSAGITTRMRIAMKYHSEANASCGDIGDGEVEDYTVSISARINTPPVANANGPYTGVVQQALRFSSDGSHDPDGSIQTYLWEFGDGNQSNEASPEYRYASSGSFTLRLTVTDNEGASHSQETMVTISDGVATLPNACADQQPITGGRLTPGQAACLGQQEVIWLSIPEVNQHQNIAISTGHGQGNLDVFYKNGGWPSETDYDASSTNAGNIECIYRSAGSQYWSYLKVSGVTTGATILVEFDSPAC
ncbi:PKD domain-containing protein [Pleionea sp. CnH1-48]|uniref:PKD domain-containing protein n=1 Tax=Pleionea sp. CnH1-48 TaxID=2954494 RepID=UPI0020977CA5|nr:PKD domain-containing protein [Pleionea sp. CnH1-48]MCO7225895.1 PKD domain-containing protein [Pleionea sp. CnH1-48]